MARILVVDDEKSIRNSMREFLRDADYEVGVAEDADKAMGMLAAEDFDIVLADIILPRVTGVSLINAINETSPHVQVILMTGEPTVETASEAVRAGAFDYLAKPIGKEQLLRTVANAAKVKALDDERRGLAEEIRQHQENLERLVEERTAALRESEARVKSILDHSPAVIALKDAQGRYQLVNKRFERLHDLTSDEVRGKTAQDIFGPQIADPYSAHDSDVLETGSAIEREQQVPTTEGIRTFIEVKFPVLDPTGGPAAIGLIATDITERKRAEEEKEKLEAQLRHAQKLDSVGTLAGGIAHDFNNILTLVCGYADMALRRLPPNGDARAHIEQVIKAGDRATDLVKQILLFSRQVEHDRKPVKLHLIVEEALKLLRASLPSTIEIRRDVDSGCDAVLADTGQIHQILINLCTNAFHAMRDGAGVLEVSLGMVEVDGEFLRSHPNLSGRKHVRLCVSDTGHGMDRATAERVFEPFFTTKGVEEGTGLGLSVVHGIVASHGGVITLDSEPGAGTTFEVYLPPADGDVERKVPIDQPIPTVEARVLFVDDEVEIARMAEQMLGQLDYDISVRTSSVEALEAFRANPDRFDVVVTDQTMPQMTGIELAGELLGIRPDLPIILVTGFADLIPPEQQQSLGIREFIMKPVVARDLSAAIQRAINQGQAAEA